MRLAAQRILAEHLREERATDQHRTDPPSSRFWPDIRLDLGGATLINFNLKSGVMADTDFGGATFSGPARFDEATFSSTASFSSLVAFGLMSSWFVHVLVNVGMTLNLMPITGIPLPFFSYGGSFMLASWLAIGILMRISYEGRGVPRAAM